MRRAQSRRVSQAKSPRARTELLESRVFLSASLLKDVNPTPDPAAAQEVGYNGALYFVGGDAAHGFELWKSNGTAAGTAMVADINPGAASSYVSGLTVVNGTLLFAATDGVHGTELWKSDGTAAGTVMVKDINPGTDPSSPASLAAYGGKVYFAATNPTSGRELWSSDGTAAGTVLAQDINPGPADSNPTGLKVAGPKLYFTALQQASNGLYNYLWASDGTQAGTAKIAQDIFDYVPAGNLLFYQTASYGLAVTDGTVAGTAQLLPASNVSQIEGVNGVALFSADDGVHGTQLWRSDGTAAGTFAIKDIDPLWFTAPGGTQGQDHAVANGRLFFAATDGTSYVLWQSDGTAAGTTVVTGAGGSTFFWPDIIAAASGAAYFSDGSALYRTDGTPGGVTLVADVGSGMPIGVTDAGSKVYFTGTGGTGTLWAGDGTAAGTALVGTVRLPSADDLFDANGSGATAVGATTYFVADDGTVGDELWKTDGTSAGTVLVKDINAGYYGSYPRALTNLNGTLLFVANNGAGGFELWRSNGTAAGTVQVKDIYAGSTGSMPDGLTVVGNVAYFAATDMTGGRELWKTDGTAAGTVRVKDINPGLTDSNPQNLVAVGGVLFFTADDGVNGRELWKTDGTGAGTVLVKDINPGAGGITLPSRNGTSSLGGTKLVFVANDGTHGQEAWVSDGTAAGTFMLADVNPGSGSAFDTFGGDLFEYGGRVYYGAASTAGRYNLWSTDGTVAGTRLFLATNQGEIENFVVLNGQMIFTVFSSGGMGTWRTDGTVGGTELLTGGLDAPLWLGTSAVFAGRVYFFAADRLHGWELFSTDGTAEGTTIAVDIKPGPDDGAQQTYDNAIVANGGHLFFPANDGLTGRGIWVLSAPGAAIAPASAAEGGTVSLNGVPAGTVPNPVDPVTYLWDLDGDGVFGETGADATRGDEVGPTPTFSAAGLDGPSTFPIALRATDSVGTTTAQASVTVTNAAPTVTIDPIPSGTNEGDMLHVTGSAADPSPADAAGLTLRWTVKRNGVTVATTTAAAVDFQTPDDGDYVVSLTATDKDGAATTASATFHVANASPTAVLADSTAVAGVPTVIQFTGAFDPSTADVAAGLQYDFDLDGDGSFELTSAMPSVTQTFATAGAHTVRARVRDKDGGESVYAATVNVSLPAGPAASLTSGGAVDEGSAGSVSFTAATGAGPFTYSYDFDNDGTFEVAGSSAATAVVPATYLADGPFTRTVRGRVTDRFGQSVDYTAGILVRNVAPTLVIPAAAGGSVVLGTHYTLSVAAADPGQDRVTSWHVAWGDRTSSDLHSAAGLVGHDYAAAGNYNITVTANDDDGSYSEARSIAVTAAPPAATFAVGSLAGDGSAYTFTVTYTDDLGIDTATLGDGDFQVAGPAGTSLARLVSIAPGSNNSVVATYAAPSPLGTWSWQDSGTYSVAARAGEVKDLQGLALPAGEVGGFTVALSPAALPDLVGAFAGPTPKSLMPGGKGTVSVKVSNRGAKSAPAANWTARLYLSVDGTIDSTDVLIGTSAQKGVALPINGSKSFAIPYAAPKAMAGGRYRLLLQVDSAGTVAERDERNNVTAAPGLVSVVTPSADLATSFATKLKPTYKAGESMALGIRVTNAGPSDAGGTATLRLYFSTDPVLDDADRLVLTSALPLKLKAKASAVFNKTMKVPAGAPAGKWYVLAVTDGASVGDRNARNNAASAAFRV